MASARRRRAIALVVAIPLVLVPLGWGLTYTPLFAARHIRIRGNQIVPDARIRALAELSSSTNVVHLDASAAADRLRTDPWIANAEVQAALPNTIVITVQERHPVGVVTGLGRTSILANDGTSLPTGETPTADLPVVRAGVGAPTQAQLDAAAALLSALAPSPADRVKEVVVNEDGTVVLTLDTGATVEAGGQGQESEKAVALRAVLRWASAHQVGVKAIDVSTPGAPSITLSDGSTASF